MNTTYFWIGLGCILSALPVIFVKKYVLYYNFYWIVLAILMNSLLIGVYYKLFQLNNSAIMYTLVKILSIILVILSSYFIYNENLSKYNILGLVLSIITVYLLSKKK